MQDVVMCSGHMRGLDHGADWVGFLQLQRLECGYGDEEPEGENRTIVSITAGSPVV